MLKNALALLFGLVLALALVEGMFRLLPVSDTVLVQDVNDRQPIFRFAPDREVLYSRGRFFELQARKRTNNQGFFSDVDYAATPGRDRVVVIGDSYVEALQVPNAQALHGVLHAAYAGRADVYGIGASGSPLSQYLAYARFARAEFTPRAFAFVIIPNDFDESMLRYKRGPGQHHYDDGFALRRIDYTATWKTHLARMSAAGRYVLNHLGGLQFGRGASGHPDAALPRFVGNMPAEVDPERAEWSRKAASRFLSDLREAVGNTPVVFIVDGLREAVYGTITAEQAADSFAGRMNRYFMDEARSAGFTVVDLHERFAADYAQHHERFEFPTDAHWNARGHRLAATALQEALAGHGLPR